MKQFFRAPVLHFAVLGALLYIGQQVWGERFEQWLNPEVIHITTDEIERLNTQWRSETGRQPSQAEQDALIKKAVDEELMFREALRLNLQYGDPVIHMRLIRNIRFIDPDSSANDQQLLEQAYRMGMLYSDLVVRRRLIQKIQHRIESANAVTEPEVRKYFEENQANYQQAPRYSFTQLFFSTAEAAANAKLKLEQQVDVDSLGEPSRLGKQHRQLSSKDIEKRFGRELAVWIESAEAGVWSEPIQSVYGHHLVLVEDKLESRPANYEEVRSRIVAEVYEKRDYQALQSELAKMRKRYKIIIDHAQAGHS